MILRVLAAAAKPALVSGAIAVSGGGAYLAYDNITGPNPTAFQRLQTAGQRLLVSEYGTTADTIVALDPADVAGSREVIATIEHAPEYGIQATLSPSGEAIAYTGLPADTERASPASPATSGIVSVDGTMAVLAEDVDLLVAPVWAPDNASIVVRKNTPCEAAGLDCETNPAGLFELIRLGTDGTRATITTWQSAAAFPIGVSQAGVLYFATLNAAGTDLYSVGLDGTNETLVAHLSDQVARDWRLSPDDLSVAYSAAESGSQPAVVARVCDLTTGAISDVIDAGEMAAGPPSTGVARGEFNPTWQPDGGLTVAALNLDGGGSAVSVDQAGLTTEAIRDDAMDLPLTWSPDGASLVVRSVEGETPFEAGASRVEILQAGTRARVSESSDVTIVGWTE